MNNFINTSEEEWIVQTPPLLRKSSNVNKPSSTLSKLPSDLTDKFPPDHRKIDIYNESEEEWILETPPNCKSLQIYDKIHGFPEKSTLKSPSVNEIALINYGKNNISEKRKFENRSPLKKNISYHALEEEWIINSHLYCNTYGTNRLFKERYEKSHCRQNQSGPCEDSEYGNMCARSYKRLNQFEPVKMNEMHEYQHLKSYFESDENNNTDGNFHKKSFNRKTIHSSNDIRESNENKFISTPFRSAYKSDKYEENKKKWTPNILAPEFVPQSTKKSLPKINIVEIPCLNKSTYSPFTLKDLLHYDVDRMPSEELTDYANALKYRILDQISDFEPSCREELEVLCQLNDGSLTDRNKKIISLRICTLVKRTVTNEPECNQQRSKRNAKFHRLAH